MQASKFFIRQDFFIVVYSINMTFYQFDVKRAYLYIPMAMSVQRSIHAFEHDRGLVSGFPDTCAARKLLHLRCNVDSHAALSFAPSIGEQIQVNFFICLALRASGNPLSRLK